MLINRGNSAPGMAAPYGPRPCPQSERLLVGAGGRYVCKYCKVAIQVAYVEAMGTQETAHGLKLHIVYVCTCPETRDEVGEVVYPWSTKDYRELCGPGCTPQLPYRAAPAKGFALSKGSEQTLKTWGLEWTAIETYEQFNRACSGGDF